MTDCCGGPATVVVELEYLVVGDRTCDRCADTRDGVRTAVADAREALSASGVALELIERELDPTRLADSNRVLVNGRPAEEWLGGHSAISECASCGELIDAFACCREIEVDGVRTEAIGRDVVFDAIMAAAGRAPVPRGAVTVTLVTSPSCG